MMSIIGEDRNIDKECNKLENSFLKVTNWPSRKNPKNKFYEKSLLMVTNWPSRKGVSWTLIGHQEKA